MDRQVYIHIPRTGGNSILRAMGSGFSGKVIQHDLRDPNYLFYKDQTQAGDRVYAFVRNPITRAFSSYHFLRQGGLHPPDALDAYLSGIKALDFEDFVKFRLEIISRWQIHFIPQTKWLNGADNLRIYRFEDFNYEFQRFCKDVHISIDTIDHVNASSNRESINLSARTIGIIQKVYREDFEMFGY